VAAAAYAPAGQAPAVLLEHVPQPRTWWDDEGVDPDSVIAEDIDPARSDPGHEDSDHCAPRMQPSVGIHRSSGHDAVTGPTSGRWVRGPAGVAPADGAALVCDPSAPTGKR
jgi:hypothetical protein